VFALVANKWHIAAIFALFTFLPPLMYFVADFFRRSVWKAMFWRFGVLMEELRTRDSRSFTAIRH